MNEKTAECSSGLEERRTAASTMSEEKPEENLN